MRQEDTNMQDLKRLFELMRASRLKCTSLHYTPAQSQPHGALTV